MNFLIYYSYALKGLFSPRKFYKEIFPAYKTSLVWIVFCFWLVAVPVAIFFLSKQTKLEAALGVRDPLQDAFGAFFVLALLFLIFSGLLFAWGKIIGRYKGGFQRVMKTLAFQGSLVLPAFLLISVIFTQLQISSPFPFSIVYVVFCFSVIISALAYGLGWGLPATLLSLSIPLVFSGVLIGLSLFLSFDIDNATESVLAKTSPGDLLNVIGYEAFVFGEDKAERLDIWTESLSKVKMDFRKEKQLPFTPAFPKKVPKGYKLEGAMFLRGTMGLAFQRQARKGYFFYFCAKGRFSDLPESEPGKHKSLIYQTYATEKLNFVVWEQKRGLIGFLVGRLGASEFARLAHGYFPK